GYRTTLRALLDSSAAVQPTCGYCLRTLKYRNLCIPHAFLEGQKAGKASPRKSTPRTLKLGRLRARSFRPFLPALPKSAGSPPLTRFQNRACTFPFTRLLSCAVLVRRTCDRLIFGGLDVMTMSMKKLEVGGFAISPTRGGTDVFAFHHVLPMFEVQSTPR